MHEYARSNRVSIPDDLSQTMHYFHPIFTRHPVTGRLSLFVDRLMTQRIEGVSPEESDAAIQTAKFR